MSNMTNPNLATAGNTYIPNTAGYTAPGYGAGVPEGSAGPHGSHVANAMGPRVDSDLDGSRNAGAAASQPRYNTAGSAAPGYGAGVPEGTAGPHSSHVANALDPRVDSDLDGSRNGGAAAATQPRYDTGSGIAGTHSVAGTGYNNNNNIGSVPDGTAGPHNSRVANTMDPRADSDLDGSHNAGASGTTNHPVGAGTTAAQTTASGGVKPGGTGTGNGIGGVFAKVHGAGEALRGAFNSKIDHTFNASHRHDAGVIKNNNVARSGLSELETGRFSDHTKLNEGVVPKATR